MSFNSFRPFEDKPHSFWKDLALAVIPAFVASVMPGIVMHYLERGEKKNEPPKKEESKPPV